MLTSDKPTGEFLVYALYPQEYPIPFTLEVLSEFSHAHPFEFDYKTASYFLASLRCVEFEPNGQWGAERPLFGEIMKVILTTKPVYCEIVLDNYEDSTKTIGQNTICYYYNSIETLQQTLSLSTRATQALSHMLKMVAWGANYLFLPTGGEILFVHSAYCEEFQSEPAPGELREIFNIMGQSMPFSERLYM